jgi:ATP-dependent helicase HrpA
MRMREWRDIHRQLRLLLRDLNWRENHQPASYEAVHRAILSGYLTNIGFRDADSKEYIGPRNRKFSLFPGSGIRKLAPKWVMSAELLETRQLFAHTNAAIRPDWIVHAAKHLTNSEYHSPFYDPRQGRVVAKEKISLRGVVLADGRRVNYTRIDPETCHKIFVAEALAGGSYRGPGKFFQHNKTVVEQLIELEDRTRRRDLHTDQEQLVRFYAARVSLEVVDLKSFERWREQVENDEPRLLYLNTGDLESSSNQEALFPDMLDWEGVQYKVRYCFQPGKEEDGVQVEIPVDLLHQVSSQPAEWLVPGLLEEKCVALVKSLPKQYRRQLVPVPEVVSRILPSLQQGSGSLTKQLASGIKRLKEVQIPDEAWMASDIEPYYLVYFRLVDSGGKQIDGGRDLSRLKQRYRKMAGQALQSHIDTEQSSDNPERSGIQVWDFGSLEETHELLRDGHKIKTWPGLIDCTESAEIKLFDNPFEAKATTLNGVSRLAMNSLKPQIKFLRKELFEHQQMVLVKLGVKSRNTFVDQLLLGVIKEQLLQIEIPRTESQFDYFVSGIRNQLVADATSVERSLLESIQLRDDIRTKLEILHPVTHRVASSAIKTQLEDYFGSDFLTRKGIGSVLQYPRYLTAIERRIDRLQGGVERDQQSQFEFETMLKKFSDVLSVVPSDLQPLVPQIRQMTELLEEWRISLFAQPMKTRFKASEKVVQRALDRLQETLKNADLTRE